jgi:SAM-dependent methyltransferase
VEKINIENKIWGAATVRLSPFHLNALRLRYALEDLKKVSGKVLEVGCGGGGMVKAIKFYRPDLEVFGCDINQLAIKQAKKNPEGVSFRAGDALSLPYQDDSFDAVLSFDLLEHLKEPKKAVFEFYRVLKANGLSHSFIPCEGSLWTLHGVLNRLGWQAKRRYGGHIQEFSSGQTKDLLTNVGFKISNWRFSGHCFNQLMDVVYFTLLELRGKKASYSVESYLEMEKDGWLAKILKPAKDATSLVSFLESAFLPFFPGSGIHVGAVKA